MVRWVGNIAIFLLVQVLFVVFFLYVSGKLPERELSLLWQAIRTGRTGETVAEPEADATATSEATAPPAKESYEERTKAIQLQASELERSTLEAKAILELASERQAAVEKARDTVLKMRKDLEKGLQSQEDQAAKQGRQQLVELLEASQPRIAKAFLLSQQNELANVAILKTLDPIAAAKIFKEFTQPDEIRRLNVWLAKLEQGEPEKSNAENVRKQIPAPN